MPFPKSPDRTPGPSRALAWSFPVASLLLASPGALAHHPGSHANRLPDGRVRLEVATLATDACTRVGTVASGAPASVKAPPGAAPVTARLVREGSGACATVVTAAKSEVVLDLGRGASHVFLYILTPDGTVASTERVPVR